MSSDFRSLTLRQAGLVDLCAATQGCPSVSIALVDGPVNTSHPALGGCSISMLGDAPSSAAGEHATFCASILVGRNADRTAGRVMAICAACTLVNVAVVTDDMLAGRLSTRTVARTLASAVAAATEATCQTILFGIEIRHPESPEWTPLRESIRAASMRGAAVVLPAGNRPGAPAAGPCSWPEALVVGSRGWSGAASAFSPHSKRGASMILAPGENVPGAGPDASYAIRSGTSFAAGVAAAAFTLAKCLAPCRPIFAIASDLCPPPTRALDATALFQGHALLS
jgi:subtilisin family serine protease